MAFQLDVCDLAGNVCELTVDPSCSVGMVKAAVQKAWGIPQRQQKLLLDDNVLFDDTELLSSRNAAELTLVIQITEQDILEQLGPVPPEFGLEGLTGCYIPRNDKYTRQELWDEAGNPKPFVELEKEFVLNEVKRYGFMSAFHPFMRQMEGLAGTKVLLIYDPDKVYGENAILCTTDHAYEREKARIEGLRQRATKVAIADSMCRTCAAATKANVEVAETSANEQPVAANAMKAGFQKDLDEAFEALNSLTKGDLVKLEAIKTPPAGVLLVAEALCIMFNVKPAKTKSPDGKGKIDDYWQPCKKMLFGDLRLLMKLMEYDKDNIPTEVMKKVSPFEHQSDFQPDEVKKGSVAACAICKWVHAMIIYDRVAKNVEQEKLALAKSENDFAVGDVLEVSPVLPAASWWCVCGVC